MSTDMPFGNCKTAALHQSTMIQSFGALVAIHVESQVIEYCSSNIGDLLGREPADLLGQTAVAWLGKAWSGIARLASLEGRIQVAAFAGPARCALSVAGHRRGSHLLLEFEPTLPATVDFWDHAKRSEFLEQLTVVRTVEQCYQFVVRWVFESTGYDRVMLYRFLKGWHGEVVTEQCRPGVQGFLGLRFPASDIPANARQMYTLNWQRMLADVQNPPTRVLPWDEQASPLDMTYSVLRAVHPVHLQYLENMGVQASFSLSLIVDGKLWGLVACHHLSPCTLGVNARLALEEMVKLVSLHLQNLLGLIAQHTRSGLREQLSHLQGSLSAASDSPKQGIAHNLTSIRGLFAATGAWLRFQGEDAFAGMVPDLVSLAPLRDWLDSWSRDTITFQETLPAALASHPALAAHASGVLFIPLGSENFILLLRQEMVQLVNWAGKPAALLGDESSAAALTPRNSFSVWVQQVRNTSEPWTDIEIEFGEILRTELLEYIGVAQLEQLALHDPLTGLANRHMFSRRLQLEVRAALTSGSQFAVHMLDLDKFKPVNDLLGHAAGDQLLKLVAARLIDLVPAPSMVARLGGDEFAVIQTGEVDKARAAALAETMVQGVAKPYDIAGHPVEIGVSVGIALCPADTMAEGELMESADLALYQVKHKGRNDFCLFERAMRHSPNRSLDAEGLMLALGNDELRLHYQPIVDGHTGELRGLESFVRWQRPSIGVLSAGQFLPLADQLHLSAAIGDWVLAAVFKQYQTWQRLGLHLVPVAINTSKMQFATQDLLGKLQQLGASYETGTQWLRLDIKEETIEADVPQAIRKLTKLRQAGIVANLDHFGQGFVPLGYLSQLPFAGLKIDGYLLQKSGDDAHAEAMLAIVTGIADVLNARLFITCIEQPDALMGLRRRFKQAMFQGHAIAAPAEAAVAEGWLRKPQQFCWKD